MFMWTTIVHSLSQVADHPMSSPCSVDRAGHVLAYRTMHSNDFALAPSMTYLLDTILRMIVLHTLGMIGRSNKQSYFGYSSTAVERYSGAVETVAPRSPPQALPGST